MTRGRWVLTIFLAASLTAAAALTYKQWPPLSGKIRKPTPAASPAENQLSSVPPFATKEPDRYQATRVITTSESANEPPGSSPLTTTQSLLIARDGENRREEFKSGSATIVYLEIPAGRFLLLPDKKLYADLNAVENQVGNGSQDSELLDVSPDRLLHEAPAGAHYENLGVESIVGGNTTKYRVTSGDSPVKTGADSVTLIWIDDELGMPIKSETSSARVKIEMELRDIKRDVDPRLFQLPPGLKKVDYSSLRTEMLHAEGVSGLAAPKTKAP